MNIPLWYVCSNKNTDSNVEHVKYLLRHNADPNICDSQNRSPLWYICSKININIELVKLLLEHNADPNICCSQNRSPLWYISHDIYTNYNDPKKIQKYFEIAELLMKKTNKTNMNNELTEKRDVFFWLSSYLKRTQKDKISYFEKLPKLMYLCAKKSNNINKDELLFEEKKFLMEYIFQENMMIERRRNIEKIIEFESTYFSLELIYEINNLIRIYVL